MHLEFKIKWRLFEKKKKYFGVIDFLFFFKGRIKLISF